MRETQREWLAGVRTALASNTAHSGARYDAVMGRLRRANRVPSVKFWHDPEAVMEAAIGAIFGLAAPRIEDAIEWVDGLKSLEMAALHDDRGTFLRHVEGLSLAGTLRLLLEGEFEGELTLSSETPSALASITVAGEDGEQVRRIYSWARLEAPAGEWLLTMRSAGFSIIGAAIGARRAA